MGGAIKTGIGSFTGELYGHQFLRQIEAKCGREF